MLVPLCRAWLYESFVFLAMHVAKQISACRLYPLASISTIDVEATLTGIDCRMVLSPVSWGSASWSNLYPLIRLQGLFDV